jgi:hypothetical protein
MSREFIAEDSLTLGGVALLTRGPDGLAPRSEEELQSVFDAAYGVDSIDASTRLPGLRAVGHALNAGDPCRATISSFLLKLPDIGETGSDRLAMFETTRKANFNQAEPRRAGKWTTGGAAISNIVPVQAGAIRVPFPMPGLVIPGYPGGPKWKGDDDYLFPHIPLLGAGHPTSDWSHTDADAKAATSEDEPKVCPSSSFEPSSVSRTYPQRLYQAQIAKLPLDFEVVLNGTRYDGCRESDGTML